MLVFWRERLVLLAMPKTGTTALEGFLAPQASMVLRDPPVMKHVPAYRFHRFLAPFLAAADGEGFETVTLVRHPVDWLSSWYRYRRRDNLIGHPNSTAGLSFDDFVREYVKGKPAPCAAVGSQMRFVSDGSGKVLVTHLFRYENQAGFEAFLQERLKVSLPTKRMNVSPKMPTPLSPEVETLLRERRAAEFTLWESAT